MAIDLTEANSFGVGKSDAFLWGNNRGLQGLERAHQQEQLRKQKEEAELADQLAKVNVDGVRDADLDDTMKSYGELKNTFSQIRGTRDQMERIRLQAKLNQQKTELSRFVNLSKTAGQQEAEYLKLPLNKPDDIADGFGKNLSELRGTRLNDTNYKTRAEYLVANALAPKYDHIGTAKKLADASILNIPESAVKVQNLGGGNKSYYTESGKKLDKDALNQNILMELNGKEGRAMMRGITKLYPDIPIKDAVKAYSDDMYESMKGKYDVMTRSGVGVVKPDNWKEKWDYKRANPIAPTFIGVPQGMTIPFGAKGKDVVTVPDYIPLSIPEKNFAGSEFIDMKTGKPSGKLKSSTDNQVVGVGNVWIIKQGTQKGSIAQPNFAKEHPDWVEQQPMIHVQQKVPGTSGIVKDILLPYRTLPVNVKNQKAIREALGNFKPATKTSNQSTPKTITMIMPNGSTGEIPSDKVEAFLKKYPKAKRQ